MVNCAKPTLSVTTTEVTAIIIDFIDYPLFFYTAFVIATKSPKIMGNYKWMLLYFVSGACFLDIFFSGPAHPMIYMSTWTIFIKGFLRNYFPSAYVIPALLFLFSNTVTSWLIMYLYRHQQLFETNSGTFGPFIRISVLVTVYLAAGVTAYFVWGIMILEQLAARRGLYQKFSCAAVLINLDGLVVIGRLVDAAAVYSLYAFVMCSLTLVIVVHSKILLRRMAAFASPTTLAIQSQYLKALMIQTVVPAFTFLFISLFSVVAGLTGFSNDLLTSLCVQTAGTHGLFTSILTLYLTKPYRDYTLRLIQKCVKLKTQPASTITVAWTIA